MGVLFPQFFTHTVSTGLKTTISSSLRIVMHAAASLGATLGCPSVRACQGLRACSFSGARVQCALPRSSGNASRHIVRMGSTGKFFIGGNWKCNGTAASVKDLVDGLNAGAWRDPMGIELFALTARSAQGDPITDGSLSKLDCWRMPPTIVRANQLRWAQ